jgi:uncharacterized SAM-binding protein YcdF (DUF218 family)
VLRLAAPLLRAIGRWLTTGDELQSADAIFVHHSKPPFGAQEAAVLLADGRAPEVWVAEVPGRPSERELARFGIERPDNHAMELTILSALGVPDDRIRLLRGTRRNTLGELQAVAARLESQGGRRVILVTSKQHCRRVRTLWKQVARGRLEAVVRGARQDPFDPDRWWLDSGEASEVIHELFGLLNAWLGSPSTRPGRDAG